MQRDRTTFRSVAVPGTPPPDRDTVFYGASLAKQFVGFLVAEEVVAGRLRTDSPAVDLLPELIGLGDIRVDHLLRHRSGMPEVTSDPALASADGAAVLEAVRGALRPPDPRPGRRAYSNTGYVLLATLLERLTGMGLPALARERIFEPLGMTASRFGGEPVRLPGVPDPPPTTGDGGLWTSAADLAVWLRALDAGPLDARAARLMRTPDPDGWSWGLRAEPTRSGVRLTHGGTWSTWLSKTVRLPDRGVAVAVLSSGSTESAISALGLDLAEVAAETEGRA